MWLAAEWSDVLPEFSLLREIIVLYKIGIAGVNAHKRLLR